jgi:endonuclease YncB( thermonuclease family)
MHGYDSAELHPSKTLIDRDAHMRIAQAAKRKLKELIEGKIVRLECIGTDKYGRVLATVYVHDVSINARMIALGYGIPYDGKKSKPEHH